MQQILNVRVLFNGTPGYSEVRRKRDSRAEAYVIECTQDPTNEIVKNASRKTCRTQLLRE